MNELELKKSLLSTPGDTIQEHIDAIHMTQAELAERIGRSIPKLNELIKGKAPITKETAAKLEYVLNVPTSFWLNLERAYQDEILEIERLEFLMNCKEWLSAFPLRIMKKLGILPDTKDKSTLAECLLRFFRVASPQQWSDIYTESSVAFKIELRHTSEPQAISVWLRLGEIQAEKITLHDFDKKALRGQLDTINDICYRQSDCWMQELQELCAAHGVALVYTPCIAKAPIYGAARWIKNNTTPLIQLTDRQKDYHAFWFSFYHELGHILYHGKKDIFLDGLESIEPDREKELEADAFAARMLLSDSDRKELYQKQSYTVDDILTLSVRYNRHPGIIVGQLQREYHQLYKNYRLNKLKPKVEFDSFSILND